MADRDEERFTEGWWAALDIAARDLSTAEIDARLAEAAVRVAAFQRLAGDLYAALKPFAAAAELAAAKGMRDAGFGSAAGALIPVANWREALEVIRDAEADDRGEGDV